MLITRQIKSTGGDYLLDQDVDVLRVWNYTEMAAAEGSGAVLCVGDRIFPNGEGFAQKKDGSWTSLKDNKGFTFVDSTQSSLGALKDLTAISTAEPPVVSAAGNDIKKGDVVRLINVTDAKQISGMDFTVGNQTLSASQFSLDYMRKLDKAGAAGKYRKVINPVGLTQSLRYITDITKGAETVIKYSVKHPYVVGDVIRQSIDKPYGMVEMNDIKGTITAIDTDKNTVTVDIDSTTFSDFKYPASGDGRCTPPHSVLSGASGCKRGASIQNNAYSGVVLAGGEGNPMGKENDIIYIEAWAGVLVQSKACCSCCGK